MMLRHVCRYVNTCFCITLLALVCWRSMATGRRKIRFAAMSGFSSDKVASLLLRTGLEDYLYVLNKSRTVLPDYELVIDWLYEK